MRLLSLLILSFAFGLSAPVSARDIGKQLSVTLPGGGGPAPAVIVLHWTNGAGRKEAKWARLLAANGYAAVVLKSARSIRGTTANLDSYEPYVPFRIQELEAANAWVKSQSWSNGRVSVLGSSHGAWVVIDALTAGQRFHKAVAASPRCDGARGSRAKLRSATPMLIVSGSNDSVVQQAPCADFARRAGPQVTHSYFPGGHDADLQSKAATAAIIRFLR